MSNIMLYYSDCGPPIKLMASELAAAASLGQAEPFSLLDSCSMQISSQVVAHNASHCER